MTPLQNEPQQHQREAKHRQIRVPHGGKRSPDSEPPRRELSKSGLNSNVVHTNVISRATPEGAPRRGHQSAPRSGQAGSSMLQKNCREPPIASAVGGTTGHETDCNYGIPVLWEAVKSIQGYFRFGPGGAKIMRSGPI
jgi:hypothetical protein